VTTPADSSAGDEYTRRLAAWRARAQQLARSERRISLARLAVVIAGVAMLLVALDTHRLSPWWTAVPAAGFTWLVLFHDRVITQRRRAERSSAFYERGLARLRHTWIGGGEPGDRFLTDGHPYATDLDLFGRGSLFELLCTARTRSGEDALAGWLRAPAVLDTVRARQAAVAELRPCLDLREDLAVLGTDLRAALDPDALAEWASRPPMAVSRAARLAPPAAVAALGLALTGWVAGFTGPLPTAVALMAEAALALAWRRRVHAIVHDVRRPDRDLALLAQLLARLEQERFQSPLLAQLRAALDTHGTPPSQSVAQLHRLLHLLDARQNQLFIPLAALLLWTTQLGLAIEAWRVRHGAAITRWLAALGEVEALCSLAAYAYEHPADPFPEVVAEGPLFAAEGLGHPLIPEDRCIRNDVTLGLAQRLLVVTGSNMSGKSTLLRAVGTNAVLALMGAPVRATRLRLCPLAVGASIRIQDSLLDGTSRFYAEIRRLRQLMDLAQAPPPLLFLLDEILGGTNSHDRRIGAAAVVRGLAERGAIGLVTTHDLALTHIADVLAPQAANVHFADHLDNGRMVFDYRLRPGMVEKSNAVALMRAVGLEV
jgi:hypothetical protein